MHLIPRFFRRTPYIAETDFAGTVVAVGTSVPVSPPNDQADSITQHGIGIGTKTFGSIPVPVHLSGSGALAEYLAIETKHITPIPSTLSLAQASTLPVSAITALDVVSLCNPQSGQRILINSPTGGVGSFATQLLRRAVGSEGVIVGICSQAGAGLARELGCDEVGDYGNYCDGSSVYERLEVYCREHGRFDAVVDCYGSQMLWGWSESLLKEGREGVYATVGPRFPSMSYWGMLVVLWQMMGNMLRPRWMGGVDRTYRQAASFIDEEKFDKVRKLAENGVIKPVVGEAFAFEDAKEVSTSLFYVLISRSMVVCVCVC